MERSNEAGVFCKVCVMVLVPPSTKDGFASRTEGPSTALLSGPMATGSYCPSSREFTCDQSMFPNTLRAMDTLDVFGKSGRGSEGELFSGWNSTGVWIGTESMPDRFRLKSVLGGVPLMMATG